MKIKEINIKNNAVLIADVHYKKGNKEFLDLLQKWINNPPSQLFLLGDIFHLLLPFDYLIEYNKEAISLINELSNKTQIFYTYGNHDFGIDYIFPNVTFCDAFVDKKKAIFLTHGDLTANDFFYKLYAKIIRNDFFFKTIHFLSFNFINNWLFNKILQKKVCCKEILNFSKIIMDKNFFFDTIIEGHYHQNKIFQRGSKIYINLGAFYCIKSYFLLQLDNNPIIKKEAYGRR
ncbi:MAG TPA: UDP-2,3-diacylglucosamine diphosphatase [Nautiliaceae bacterium]|nr:UDP-2,3-diacylglucosamine diphosphatase [Nautiliaceae bacterium]